MKKAIQIYHIVENIQARISDEIWKSISGFYTIEIHGIKLAELDSIKEKKVHLLIFDGTSVADVSYPLISPIIDNNKKMFSAIVMESNERDATIAYEKHFDYIFEKTYDDRYLKAQLKSILLRYSTRYQQDALSDEFENIFVDKLLREIRVSNVLIETTNKEYRLIRTLVQHSSNFITKQNLFKKVWGHEDDNTRILDQYLFKIKKKIGSDVTIVSDRNLGVQLVKK